MARRREELIEMFKQQNIRHNEETEKAFVSKARMQKDNFGTGLGYSPKNENKTLLETDEAYQTLYNRSRRLSEEIRQKTLEISGLINQNNPSPAHQRKIAVAQGELFRLQSELRAIDKRLSGVHR